MGVPGRFEGIFFHSDRKKTNERSNKQIFNPALIGSLLYSAVLPLIMKVIVVKTGAVIIMHRS